MKKDRIISMCLVSTSLLALNSCSHKSPEQPSFVFIIADDVSWDDFGCYGNTQVKTPIIDRLASMGLQFDNFFLTASSSSPSRNSIITGRYPHNTGGAELHSLPPDYMVAFTEVLRNSGYYTAQAGKFHMGKYARRGFDTINEIGKRNGDGGEELWLKVLNDRPADKPFFMWFASYDAHRPWGTNEFTGSHIPEDVAPPFYLPDEELTRQDLARYYDEITRLDNYIGQIVSELEHQKILENTVIIITADNGRPFPHSKTRVNDRGLRAPLIIFWPKGIGVNPARCDALVSSIDLAPTILELAYAKIPESFQGYSFVKNLKNPDEKFRNYVFAEHNWHDYEAHERMVRTKEFLYILNSRPQFPNLGPADVLSGDTYKEMLLLRERNMLDAKQSEIFMVPRPNEELYDNASDPDQLVNISSDPEKQAILAELREILKEWMVATGDNIPDSITKDWYLREPGNIKTDVFNIRGEPVNQKNNATLNNNKGKF